MKNLIENKTKKEVLRPPVIPDRNRVFWIFLLASGTIWLIAAMLFRNRVMMATSIVLLMFPFILLLRLYWHFTWSIIVCEEKLIIHDYSFTSYLAIGRYQEIHYKDIDYIYYLEKEYHSLKNYRHKLRKYNISSKETDYRKENLINKYSVPIEIINDFESGFKNTLDDYTATGILMTLENILDKYPIPKGEKKKIIKELKTTSSFNYENIQSLLCSYHISPEDHDILEDEFSNVEMNYGMPFLLSKLNVAQVENMEDKSRSIPFMVSVNAALVFSNRDGTKKVYLKKFHSLARTDWQKLINTINQNKPNIGYLMPRRSCQNLSDPNFKPGCG